MVDKKKLLLDDQPDPEVIRLQRHIATLERQMAESGNPERDSKVLKLKAENSRLRGAVKAAHHELDVAQQRNELLLQTGAPPAIEKWKKLAKGKGKATAIVALSDWHVEERIEADKVNGLNEYNMEIAAQRIKRTFQKVIYLLERARGAAKIDTLVVWLGGDFISGYIHEELQEQNAVSPLDACLFAQDQIISGLEFLKKEAKASLVVPTSYGNHGRTTQKKRHSTGAENSYEYNLYRQMERYYAKDPKVAFKVERGYHNHLEVQGRLVRFHHGDNLKYYGGVGGLSIPVNKAIAQWNKSVRAELDIFGHFHQFSPGGRRWLCNGSVIGYSPYAVAIKAEYEHPVQSFVVMDRDYGNTMTVPIFCTEAKQCA